MWPSSHWAYRFAPDDPQPSAQCDAPAATATTGGTGDSVGYRYSRRATAAEMERLKSKGTSRAMREVTKGGDHIKCLARDTVWLVVSSLGSEDVLRFRLASTGVRDALQTVSHTHLPPEEALVRSSSSVMQVDHPPEPEPLHRSLSLTLQAGGGATPRHTHSPIVRGSSSATGSDGGAGGVEKGGDSGLGRMVVGLYCPHVYSWKLLRGFHLHMHGIVTLDVSRNRLGDSGIALLIMTLKDLPKLKTLGLASVLMSLSGGRVLVQHLTPKTAKNLVDLNLADNVFNDSVGVALEGLLRTTEGPFLQSLNLNDCKFSLKASTGILGALVHNTHLRSLQMQENQLLDKANGHVNAVLAKLIRENKTLTMLDLSNCGLGDSGATSVASGLEANSTLQSLSLKFNDIKDQGGCDLAVALGKNKTLVVLDLYWNRISWSGGANKSGAGDRLCSALRDNEESKVQFLHLYGNRISQKELRDAEFVLSQKFKRKHRGRPPLLAPPFSFHPYKSTSFPRDSSPPPISSPTATRPPPAPFAQRAPTIPPPQQPVRPPPAAAAAVAPPAAVSAPSGTQPVSLSTPQLPARPPTPQFPQGVQMAAGRGSPGTGFASLSQPTGVHAAGAARPAPVAPWLGNYMQSAQPVNQFQQNFRVEMDAMKAAAAAATGVKTETIRPKAAGPLEPPQAPLLPTTQGASIAAVTSSQTPAAAGQAGAISGSAVGAASSGITAPATAPLIKEERAPATTSVSVAAAAPRPPAAPPMFAGQAGVGMFQPMAPAFYQPGAPFAPTFPMGFGLATRPAPVGVGPTAGAAAQRGMTAGAGPIQHGFYQPMHAIPATAPPVASRPAPEAPGLGQVQGATANAVTPSVSGVTSQPRSAGGVATPPDGGASVAQAADVKSEPNAPSAGAQPTRPRGPVAHPPPFPPMPPSRLLYSIPSAPRAPAVPYAMPMAPRPPEVRAVRPPTFPAMTATGKGPGGGPATGASVTAGSAATQSAAAAASSTASAQQHAAAAAGPAAVAIASQPAASDEGAQPQPSQPHAGRRTRASAAAANADDGESPRASAPQPRGPTTRRQAAEARGTPSRRKK
ncbi:unnamed protein product [Vitrella brassicaformis CCMP3155]|uniref:Uncharacterized protein n=3 Tax=Vitrella brassicaformis TaxID=1169539 RepID=A0A0G4FA09_VITBC|nr:unnamed protein product [Vitrella brassicaformis CCMP3155]|eukprot:CEM09121.1 unnamed protein product [Vitrella brassicaformis CCMP3155]